MAILLAAGVPFQRWIRFALGGILLLRCSVGDGRPRGGLTFQSLSP